MAVARTPRVKFCGITRIEDAQHAVALGAWAIGLNLWAGSARVVLPQEAADIADAVRRRTEIVGVFVNEELDALVTLAEEIGLTMVQLHGDEGPSYAQAVRQRTGAKVIKAGRIRDLVDVKALSSFSTDYRLLDSYVPGVRGGSGAVLSWELARKIKSYGANVPTILAGGLTPENVAEAVDIVRPFAVDVASGIESAPGVKDPAKMDAFVAALAPAEPAAPAVPTDPADPADPTDPADPAEVSAP